MASEKIVGELFKIFKIMSARGEIITKGTVKNFISANDEQYKSHSDRDISDAIEKYRKYRDDNFIPAEDVPEPVKTAADEMVRMLCGLANAERKKEVEDAEKKHQDTKNELAKELEEERTTNEDLQAQLLEKTNKITELEEKHRELLNELEELQKTHRDLELKHVQLMGKYEERIDAMRQMEQTIANLTYALEMNGISLSAKAGDADSEAEKEG